MSGFIATPAMSDIHALKASIQTTNKNLERTIDCLEHIALNLALLQVEVLALKRRLND